METTLSEVNTSPGRTALEYASPEGVLKRARKELGELDGLRPVRITAAVATSEHTCNQCTIPFGEGREVLWIRIKDDDAGTVIGGVTLSSTWKAKPWHRRCWDEFEAAIDKRRVELERILGEDHHELDA